jgi:hypothetical protein
MSRDSYSIQAAFFTVCADAEPAKAHYVSLYRVEPFYGGPEEGGWWGRDYVHVASQKCASAEHASSVRANVEQLAKQLSEDARNSYLAGCAAECAWLESRGLDADYLPEVDGESSYEVYVEDVRGEMASTGSRHWE